ncbi:MAG: hypothetical protein LBN36_02290 [Clostridiales Family XIII bacterium]|jgi:TRAP-type C4-dicarboxylate transport system substrate-binding protein|nr:hypothetical protein [Clostridiales Family XIII bacterium]
MHFKQCKLKSVVAAALVFLTATAFTACGESTSDRSTIVTVVDAEEPVYELRMDIPVDADSIVGRYLYDWATNLKEVSGRRLYITIYPNSQLGAASDTVDNLKKGVSDLAWASSVMFPGRFPVTEGTNLPLLNIPSARIGTDLLDELYHNTDLMQEEYEGIRPLAIYTAVPYAYSAFVLMNPDAYGALPDDLKEIFDAYCDKKILAYGLGEATAEEAAFIPGTPAPSFSDAAFEKWIKEMADSGYDGQVLLDTYIRILAELNG